MSAQDALLLIRVDGRVGGCEGRGEELGAVVRPVVGEAGREGELHLREVVAELVPRAQPEGAVVGHAAAALVGVAGG